MSINHGENPLLGRVAGEGENVRTTTLSLWSGGLLYRIGRRIHLLKNDRLDVVRRSVAALLVAWAPLMLLVLLQGLMTRSWNPLLFDLPNHIRWWIAVPLLFLAERLIDERLARTSSYLRDTRIVAGASQVKLTRLEERTMECCESSLLEAVLLAIAVATCAGQIRAASDPAGLWFAAVTLPLSRFLVLRWLQRWIVWTVLLARISLLKLDLNGLHPDRAGGLGVLVQPSRALSVVFFAMGTVMTANLAQRMAPGETLDGHLPSIATYAGLCVALATFPLACFMPIMVRAKREALWSYGVFGQSYVQDFRARWLPRAEDSPLGSSDIQSLADLGNAHEVIKGMRLVPFPRDFVVQIAVAALLPLLPLYLHTVSMTTLTAQIVKVIF